MSSEYSVSQQCDRAEQSEARVSRAAGGLSRDRQIDRRMGSDRCEGEVGELGWAVCKQCLPLLTGPGKIGVEVCLQ